MVFQTTFKHKCPNCGKPTINMNPNKDAFCDKYCEKNYKYGDKFIDDRYFETTPLK